MHISYDELKQLYLELVTTIVPGPASWSYLVLIALLPLGLLVPPSVLSHGQLCAVVLPISIVATIHAWNVLGGNDVISTHSLYLTLFLYLFKDPRQESRRIIRANQSRLQRNSKMSKQDGNNDDEVLDSRPVVLEAYPETFTGRLDWAMMLPQSRPLHDWIIGEPGHDRRVVQAFKHPTRFEFLADILTRLTPVLLVLLPLSKQLAMNDPYFSDPGWSLFDPDGFNHSGEGTAEAFLRTSVPVVILRPVTMAMYAYFLLLGLFLPLMLFVLLLNALRLIPDSWSPHTWRPHFGPFSAIAKYGVRGFWGRWWHQQMRHIVAEPGRWLAAKLALENHGWQKIAKYMLICVSAFTLSGITHLGMVSPKPRWLMVSASDLRLSLAGFFWIQPVGIAIELSLLEPTWRKLPASMRALQALLRVMWTVAFVCFSCTFLVLPFGQLGYRSIVPSQYIPCLF